MDILSRLQALREEPFAAFQRKLIPTAPPETIIGVRTPALRALARELAGTAEAEAFLGRLPHAFFDENQLHAFLLGREKDFDRCAARVDAFLPFVDNWATCDQLSPEVFRRHREALLPLIRRWLQAEHPYTVRFAMGLLMQHFLDGAFDPAYPALVAGVRSGEYYVDMMAAWYFATALAKQYDAVLPYLAERRLPPRIHAKANQKALESDRIPPERKAYLKTLRISGKTPREKTDESRPARAAP